MRLRKCLRNLIIEVLHSADIAWEKSIIKTVGGKKKNGPIIAIIGIPSTLKIQCYENEVFSISIRDNVVSFFRLHPSGCDCKKNSRSRTPSRTSKKNKWFSVCQRICTRATKEKKLKPQ